MAVIKEISKISKEMGKVLRLERASQKAVAELISMKLLKSDSKKMRLRNSKENKLNSRYRLSCMLHPEMYLLLVTLRICLYRGS